MRVVFLDIDGVLFTRRSQQAYDRALGSGALESDDERVRAFEPRAVESLHVLHEAIPFAVVVSSTWRLRLSIQHLRALLGPMGHWVVDTTGPERATRAQEVSEWLAGRSAPRNLPAVVESFVILDDIDDGLSLRFPGRFVRCDPDRGFGDPGQIKQARGILRAPLV